MSHASAFSGSVPKVYHSHLVPLIFEPYARDMAGRVKVGAGERVLELACGTGVVTKELVKGMVGSARLTATDLNEGMLELARPYVGADARVTYEKVDACELPYEDGSFDAIACQFGVMFFPDKVKAMREARRALKRGGRYVFNVWDSLEHNPIARTLHETVAGMFASDPPMFLPKLPFGWFDRGEIERVVRAGGFERCEMEAVEFVCAAPSAEEGARGFLEGTPVVAQLAERGVTDLGPFREAGRKALAERFGERPCRSTMRAVVVTAG